MGVLLGVSIDSGDAVCCASSDCAAVGTCTVAGPGMISSVLSIDLHRNDEDDVSHHLCLPRNKTIMNGMKTTTHISFCSAANTISIIIGSGTVTVEVDGDGVGDRDSGIVGIGRACASRKFDHSRMADATIHPSFMVDGEDVDGDKRPSCF